MAGKEKVSMLTAIYAKKALIGEELKVLEDACFVMKGGKTFKTPA